MVAKKSTEKAQTIAFEDRVERLQEIVEALEQGNVSLADSIDLYKEGLSHSKLCREELEKARHEIQILTNTDQTPLSDTTSFDSTNACWEPFGQDDTNI